MAKCHVTLIYSAAKYVTVEADSAESAENIAASEHGHVSLCHHCADKLEVDDLCKIEVEEAAQ